MKKITMLLFFLLTVGHAEAQDIIYQVFPTDTINCKVTEVGEEKICYIDDRLDKKTILSINRNRVERIIFANGQTIDISIKKLNNQIKNVSALKLSLLTPTIGATIFSYEQSLKPGLSLEFGAGIIGLGYDAFEFDPKGVVLRGGVKFRQKPSYFLQHNHKAHILKGLYFGPELIYSHYKSDMLGQELIYLPDNFGYMKDVTWRVSNSAFSLMINGGHQWVINNSLLIDLFGGIGCVFGNYNTGDNLHYYGFSIVGSKVPISLNLGVKFGFILNREK